MSRELVHFEPFALDRTERCLWRGAQRVPLTPKDFAVLSCLVERAGSLVTQEALLEAGWPHEVVVPGALKVRLRRLRHLLGDDAEAPRFIATVRGYGYRFIARIAAVSPPAAEQLIGRGPELATLRDMQARAWGGTRQFALVSGEAGIGKTALVDTMIDELERATPAVLIARGQCIEHHGAGEAYLPFLEAIGRLCRRPEGVALLAILRAQAPSWLAQLPALLDAADWAALQRAAVGVAKERMLRELADALEAFTAEHPLVVCLEDLHWADYSTLDLLAYLAQRRSPARLLLIGTCRREFEDPTATLLVMIRELQVRRSCTEIPLPLLAAQQVETYLEGRVAAAPGADWVLPLAAVLFKATAGHPLFMVAMTDALLAQSPPGDSATTAASPNSFERLEFPVPDTLRQLVERWISRQTPEQAQILASASVVGVEFSARIVAHALGIQDARVEEVCDALVRSGRVLRSHSPTRFADGTISGRYGFAHAIFQKIVYERQTAAARARAHHRVALALESAVGERALEHAAELAGHFERGLAPAEALYYLGEAARNAVRRSANREAIDLLSRALELVDVLPDATERIQQELTLRVALAVPLMMTRGSTALEVKNVYRRAKELCDQVGDTPLLLPVLVGLGRFGYGWRTTGDSSRIPQQIVAFADASADPAHSLVAHMLVSGNLFFQGRFERSREHADRGLALYEPDRHRALILQYGDDPQVLCLCWTALAAWYLGEPTRARKQIGQAVAMALALGHPYGEAFARFWRAFICQACGDVTGALTDTEALLRVTAEHHIPQFAAMGTILHGWARSMRGERRAGIEELRGGIEALRATRQELGRPYFLALLADAYRHWGQCAEGLEVVREALDGALQTGECMHLAELHRLRGELLLAAGPGPGFTPQVTAEAIQCFGRAAETAREQRAKALELRALLSDVRLRQRQVASCADETESAAVNQALVRARQQLVELVEAFSAGSDSADLRAAREILTA